MGEGGLSVWIEHSVPLVTNAENFRLTTEDVCYFSMKIGALFQDSSEHRTCA